MRHSGKPSGDLIVLLNLGKFGGVHFILYKFQHSKSVVLYNDQPGKSVILYNDQPCKSVILYNDQPCKSVIWRIVSQRRTIKSPEGLPECRINFYFSIIPDIFIGFIIFQLNIHWTAKGTSHLKKNIFNTEIIIKNVIFENICVN
jgi:hypothetical protein